MNHTQHLSNYTRAIILLFVMSILCFNPQAVAASCVEPGDPETEFNSEAAVFSGTVIYISSVNGLLIDGTNKVLMSIGFHPADIYGKILQGRKIVFQVDRAWKSVQTSSLCHRTLESPNNSEDIAYLKNLPTLQLSYFPAIIRTLDGSQIITTVLLLVGFVYIFRQRRKHG